MTYDEGSKVAAKIRDAGYTLKGYCRNNGFNKRTFQAVLYQEMGHKVGGPRHDAILHALKRDGFYPVDDSEKEQAA